MAEKEQTVKKDSEDPKITKDMKIGDIVEKYPETTVVMMQHGMHCVGCHVATMETLEEGAKSHGMDDDRVEDMVKKMNDVVEGKSDKESSEKKEDD